MSTPSTPAPLAREGREPFDMRYHASQNRHGIHDVMNPCSICGWERRMAIHDKDQPRGKHHIPFHEYQQ